MRECSRHGDDEALALAGSDCPAGEYRARQPITVWTGEAACSYNWGTTLLG